MAGCVSYNSGFIACERGQAARDVRVQQFRTDSGSVHGHHNAFMTLDAHCYKSFVFQTTGQGVGIDSLPPPLRSSAMQGRRADAAGSDGAIGVATSVDHRGPRELHGQNGKEEFGVFYVFRGLKKTMAAIWFG